MKPSCWESRDRITVTLGKLCHAVAPKNGLSMGLQPSLPSLADVFPVPEMLLPACFHFALPALPTT